MSVSSGVSVPRVRRDSARDWHPRPTTGLHNFPELVETEVNADRLALITAIVEHDAVGLGRDLFEAEGDRGLSVQPGPPVGIQLGAANRLVLATRPRPTFRRR